MVRSVGRASRVFSVCLALVIAVLGQACGSYRFRPTHARSVPEARAWNAIVPEVVDARAMGESRGGEGRSELDEVRLATREHLTLAGLVRAESPIVPAPTSEAELHAVLDDAARDGAELVVFVRYHHATPVGACYVAMPLAGLGVVPWLIANSLNIAAHAGSSVFEVLAVDPRTGALLGRATHEAMFASHTNGWSCAPFDVMQDTMGRSLQAALEDLAAQRDEGWPGRAGDATASVLHGPTVRVEGDRFAGPGWSVSLASEGWRPTAGRPSRIPIEREGREGVFVREDGLELTFMVWPTWDDADASARAMVEHLGSGDTRTVSVRDAQHERDVRVVVREGEVDSLVQLEGAVAVPGAMLISWVRGTPERIAAFRETFLAMMASAQFDGMLRAGERVARDDANATPASTVTRPVPSEPEPSGEPAVALTPEVPVTPELPVAPARRPRRARGERGARPQARATEATRRRSAGAVASVWSATPTLP